MGWCWDWRYPPSCCFSGSSLSAGRHSQESRTKSQDEKTRRVESGVKDQGKKHVLPILILESWLLVLSTLFQSILIKSFFVLLQLCIGFLAHINHVAGFVIIQDDVFSDVGP